MDGAHSHPTQSPYNVQSQLNTHSQWIAIHFHDHHVISFYTYGFGLTTSYEGFAYVPWDGPIWYDDADEQQSALFVQDGEGWVWRDASQDQPTSTIAAGQPITSGTAPPIDR